MTGEPPERDGDTPRLEFLLCGSPNAAFYSQMAFFRHSLDRLGAAYRAARVVAVFGGDEQAPIPPRWKPSFERIEVAHASVEAFRQVGFYAASNLRYDLLDPKADVSCLCDADTAFLNPLPGEFFEEMKTAPALAAVVAHYPFPILEDSRDEFDGLGLYPGMPQAEAWDRIGQLVLGRRLARPLRYNLLEGADDPRCPFYVNYGFLAGPPGLLAELYRHLQELHPVLARVLRNDFYGQAAIALAVEKASLPWRALPVRFNFPNVREADRLHPAELEAVVLLHYLRHTIFDRHQIFSSAERFEEFLAMDLVGSDRTFREHVSRVTGGEYPFSPTAPPSGPAGRETAPSD